LKAVHQILVSSAETRRGFNSGFDTVNLHRPTGVRGAGRLDGVSPAVIDAGDSDIDIEREAGPDAPFLDST
jgi:hypothetical protein